MFQVACLIKTVKARALIPKQVERLQQFLAILIFSSSNISTDINDEENEEEPVRSIDDMMKGWFKFVQIEDGSIPAVFHSKTENSHAVNFKKTIAAAFQANFEGTSSKVEADPQSLHTAKYT